jgi:hypothetical protein
MPADVKPLTWNTDPDSVPSNPIAEVKEALVGDGESIIGAIPDIGPVESESAFDTSYHDEVILLDEISSLGSDTQDDTEEFDLTKLAPALVYSNLKEKYGDSFINWEPETLKIVLSDDFELNDIPDNVWESILATRVAGAGIMWEDYTAFEKGSLAVSGSPVHPGTIQHVSVEEMSEMYKLMNSIDPEGTLSDEVARYIAARMHTDGYLYCGSAFPSEVQEFIFELGAPRSLTDSVHEKVLLVLDQNKEGIRSLGVSIEDLGTSAVDIQVARYISLL